MELEPTQAIPLSDYDEDDDETDDETSAAEKQHVAHLKVIVQKGHPEKLFPIYEGLNMIGRAPTCNIHIELKALSKEHALIEVQGREHFIVDQGSKNRTRRNKMFLKKNVRYELRGGESLTFADVECQYVMSSTQSANEEMAKESFIYEADDSDDPSSDILQPTQAYGKGPKTVLAAQMYVPESDDDSSPTKLETSGSLFVGETPAPTKPKAMRDTSLVIPESDVEQSPISSATPRYQPRVSMALTETICYVESDSRVNDSDVTTEDETSPRKRQRVRFSPAPEDPTQAYVMDTEDAETAEALLDKRRREVSSMDATQAYVMDSEDQETGVTPLRKRPAVNTASTAANATDATQAYVMDSEDQETYATLLTKHQGVNAASPNTSSDTKLEDAADDSKATPETEKVSEPAHKPVLDLGAGATLAYEFDSSDEDSLLLPVTRNVPQLPCSDTSDSEDEDTTQKISDTVAVSHTTTKKSDNDDTQPASDLDDTVPVATTKKDVAKQDDSGSETDDEATQKIQEADTVAVTHSDDGATQILTPNKREGTGKKGNRKDNEIVEETQLLGNCDETQIFDDKSTAITTKDVSFVEETQEIPETADATLIISGNNNQRKCRVSDYAMDETQVFVNPGDATQLIVNPGDATQLIGDSTQYATPVLAVNKRAPSRARKNVPTPDNPAEATQLFASSSETPVLCVSGKDGGVRKPQMQRWVTNRTSSDDSQADATMIFWAGDSTQVFEETQTPCLVVSKKASPQKLPSGPTRRNTGSFEYDPHREVTAKCASPANEPTQLFDAPEDAETQPLPSYTQAVDEEGFAVPAPPAPPARPNTDDLETQAYDNEGDAESTIKSPLSSPAGTLVSSPPSHVTPTATSARSKSPRQAQPEPTATAQPNTDDMETQAYDIEDESEPATKSPVSPPATTPSPSTFRHAPTVTATRKTRTRHAKPEPKRHLNTDDLETQPYDLGEVEAAKESVHSASSPSTPPREKTSSAIVNNKTAPARQIHSADSTTPGDPAMTSGLGTPSGEPYPPTCVRGDGGEEDSPIFTDELCTQAYGMTEHDRSPVLASVRNQAAPRDSIESTATDLRLELSMTSTQSKSPNTIPKAQTSFVVESSQQQSDENPPSLLPSIQIQKATPLPQRKQNVEEEPEESDEDSEEIIPVIQRPSCSTRKSKTPPGAEVEASTARQGRAGRASKKLDLDEADSATTSGGRGRRGKSSGKTSRAKEASLSSKNDDNEGIESNFEAADTSSCTKSTKGKRTIAAKEVPSTSDNKEVSANKASDGEKSDVERKPTSTRGKGRGASKLKVTEAGTTESSNKRRGRSKEKNIATGNQSKEQDDSDFEDASIYSKNTPANEQNEIPDIEQATEQTTTKAKGRRVRKTAKSKTCADAATSSNTETVDHEGDSESKPKRGRGRGLKRSENDNKGSTERLEVTNEPVSEAESEISIAASNASATSQRTSRKRNTTGNSFTEPPTTSRRPVNAQKCDADFEPKPKRGRGRKNKINKCEENASDRLTVQNEPPSDTESEVSVAVSNTSTTSLRTRGKRNTTENSSTEPPATSRGQTTNKPEGESQSVQKRGRGRKAQNKKGDENVSPDRLTVKNEPLSDTESEVSISVSNTPTPSLQTRRKRNNTENSSTEPPATTSRGPTTNIQECESQPVQKRGRGRKAQNKKDDENVSTDRLTVKNEPPNDTESEASIAASNASMTSQCTRRTRNTTETSSTEPPTTARGRRAANKQECDGDSEPKRKRGRGGKGQDKTSEDTASMDRLAVKNEPVSETESEVSITASITSQRFRRKHNTTENASTEPPKTSRGRTINKKEDTAISEPKQKRGRGRKVQKKPSDDSVSADRLTVKNEPLIDTESEVSVAVSNTSATSLRARRKRNTTETSSTEPATTSRGRPRGASARKEVQDGEAETPENSTQPSAESEEQKPETKAAAARGRPAAKGKTAAAKVDRASSAESEANSQRRGRKRAQASQPTPPSEAQTDESQEPVVKKGRRGAASLKGSQESVPTGGSCEYPTTSPATPARAKSRTTATVEGTPRSASRRTSQACDLPAETPGTPTLRNRQGDRKPRVMFTGVVDESGQKIIKTLGGELVDSMEECTHLVTDKVRRTMKFLCGVARGLHIVQPQWLVQCKQAQTFIDATAYTVADRDAEQQYGFCLASSLERVRAHGGMLTGYRVHVTKSVKPEPAIMKEIILSAGGTYAVTMPKKQADRVVVVSCDEDDRLCRAARGIGIPVVSAELILTGMLRQTVDVEAYTLQG